jgi:RimJ/RimL family protein N-acetyltransferase
VIATARLVLREWSHSDIGAIERVNRDSRVRLHLNSPPPDHAWEFLENAIEHWRTHGFGLFAIEDRRPGRPRRCLGFAGASYSTFAPEHSDTPELAWRLDPACWGHGLATEAARAARDHVFAVVGLDAVVSMIQRANVRSRRVALKLAMREAGQTWNAILAKPTDLWRLDADEWRRLEGQVSSTPSLASR